MKENIIFRAPVFSLSGYGAHARDLALALFDSMKFNMSIAPTGWAHTSTTDQFPPDILEKLVFMAGNRFETNNFTFIHLGIPTEFQKLGKVNIGITAGLESSYISKEWVDKCNLMNAIIVPSAFIKDVFLKSGVTVPVYVVPEGVNLGIYNNTVESTLQLPLDTKFNFLTSGHWIRGPLGTDRKQIGLLIRTFLDTFADREDVGLIVKTQTMNHASPDLHFTKDRILQLTGGKAFPRIYLLHGVMTEKELAQLYRHPQIHAFVSMTSGESWFRPLAEAVASDLPVLVTGYSGHMDYLHPDLCTVFDYKLVDVPPSAWSKNLFEKGMRWALPNVDDVKRKLVRCIERYEIAKERAVKLGESFRNDFSYERASDLLVTIVEDVITTTKPKDAKVSSKLILDSGVEI